MIVKLMFFVYLTLCYFVMVLVRNCLLCVFLCTAWISQFVHRASYEWHLCVNLKL